MWYKNIAGRFFGLVTKDAFVSDIAIFVLKRDVKLQPTNKGRV